MVLIDGNDTDGVDIEIETNLACTSDSDGYDWYDETSGNIKMRYKLWHDENFLSSKIGCYTESWRKVGGTWKKKKAGIACTVRGVFRDDDCNWGDQKDGSKSRSNDKKVQKTKNKGFFTKYSFANGEIQSTHMLIKDGTVLAKGLTLNPCD